MSSEIFTEVKSRGDSHTFPEVYKYLGREVPTQDLVGYIFQQFYRAADPEALCLCFDELFSRGFEGEAALRWMASDTGEVGDVVKRVIDGNQNGVPTEDILGITRVENIVTFGKEVSRENIRILYEVARQRGYLDDFPQIQTLQSFARYHSSLDVDDFHLIPGNIEKQVVNFVNTFGNSEPGYLEMMGPRGVLQLRSLQEPQFLLVGSLGAPSARDFAFFAKKVNKNSRPHVIDIHRDRQSQLEPYQGENGLNFRYGSAFQMPFQEGSMDSIYTNYLLHSLVDSLGRSAQTKEQILHFLTEVSRVLRSGGTCILLEFAYGLHITQNTSIEKIQEELESLGQKVGLKSTRVKRGGWRFAFQSETLNQEVGRVGTTVSEYGFAHYGSALIVDSDEVVFGMKFEKV